MYIQKESSTLSSDTPINLIPTTVRPWPSNACKGCHRSVRTQQMMILLRSTSKSTFWMLASHDRVDAPGAMMSRLRCFDDGNALTHAPLLVRWIQRSPKRVEPLNRPKVEPWLTCILADDSFGKSLAEVSCDPLEMKVPLQNWLLVVRISRDVWPQYGLCALLLPQSCCWIAICLRRCREHGRREEVGQEAW